MSEKSKDSMWPAFPSWVTLIICVFWVPAWIAISEVLSCSHDDQVSAAAHRCEIGGRGRGCILNTSRVESYSDALRQSSCRCAQPGGVRAYYTVEWSNGGQVKHVDE